MRTPPRSPERPLRYLLCIMLWWSPAASPQESAAVAFYRSRLHAQERHAEERYAEAAQLFRTLAEANPDDGNLWLGWGQAASANGDTEASRRFDGL